MLITLDEQDPRPIYAQLVAQIKEQVATGVLRPDDELPSVRELAGSLDINLHTVHRAYQKLRDEKVIRLRLGQRARVLAPRYERASRSEIEARLSRRLEELITEATHLGLTLADLKALVNERLNARKKLMGK